jgi:CheY-like chemotaxis protein
MSRSAVRVLVVEDEPDLCQLIERHLKRAGYDVAGARSGAEALERINSGPAYDLYLVDLSLPDIQGDEVAAEILRLQPSARILITSGHALPESIRVNSASVRFLPKPFPPKRLEQALKDLAAG